MEISVVENYDKLSEIACDKIIKTITGKPDALLCLSTGETPKQTYKNIKLKYDNNPNIFSKIRLIKFDEWCDIPLTDDCSCESYLNKFVLEPLNIKSNRFISYGNQSDKAVVECHNINNYLLQNGPIDFILLGLGLNGHIGLIEPSTSIKQHAHINRLSEITKKHSMLNSRSIIPEYGITLGIADIFKAKKALLLVEGRQKIDIVKNLLQGDVSTHLPASLLWLHNNVEVLIDGSIFNYE